MQLGPQGASSADKCWGSFGQSSAPEIAIIIFCLSKNYITVFWQSQMYPPYKTETKRTN